MPSTNDIYMNHVLKMSVAPLCDTIHVFLSQFVFFSTIIKSEKNRFKDTWVHRGKMWFLVLRMKWHYPRKQNWFLSKISSENGRSHLIGRIQSFLRPP